MDIDLLDYVRVPNISLRAMQALGKTLLANKPEPPEATIAKAAANLGDQIERVDAALTARHIAENPELAAGESRFDSAVDGLWIMLRRGLELEQGYAHEGLDALPPELADEAELAEAREHAARAKRLWARLFAAEGTDWVRAAYLDQSEIMAAILRMLKQEELHDELEAVVGPRLLRLLRVSQRHYEAMVADRLNRERGLGENLWALRQQLRQRIIQYNTAVFGLLNDLDEPEQLERVKSSLRAMITLRAHLNSPKRGEGDEELIAVLEDEGEGGEAEPEAAAGE